MFFYCLALFPPPPLAAARRPGRPDRGLLKPPLRHQGCCPVCANHIHDPECHLHEGLHGSFSGSSRARSRFSPSAGVCVCRGPDWYLPRNQFLVTARAPLIGISLLGTGSWLCFHPACCANLYFYGVNANGSTADIWVAVKLLLHPRTCLATTAEDSFTSTLQPPARMIALSGRF